MNLQRLKELAEKATPGPWVEARPGLLTKGDWDSVFVDDDTDCSDCICYNVEVPDDAQFIAACDPQTILKLIAAVEAAREMEYRGMTVTTQLGKALRDLDGDPNA